MKKYFFMQPRMSGKTTLAQYEFLKNPKESLYIGLNMESAFNTFNGSLRGDFKNITGQHNNHEMKLHGGCIKNVIIDDYLYFDDKNKKRLHLLLNTFPQIEDIYIFSTSKIQYNSKIIDFIREYKRKMSISDMKKILKTLCPLNDLSYFDELCCNFLTDHDCTIISNDKTFISGDRHKHDITGLRYKLEVLNQWKIDDKQELKIKEEYEFSQYSSPVNVSTGMWTPDFDFSKIFNP